MMKKVCGSLIFSTLLITYIIVSLIIGGRLGYIIFYNLEYYISNPIDIIKIWEGGMSFHGALIGIILGTYIFSKLRNTLSAISLLLDLNKSLLESVYLEV